MFVKQSSVKKYHTSGDSWNFRWFVFYTQAGLHFPLNTLIQINEIGIEEWISNECLNLLKLNSTEGKISASAAYNYLYSKWLSHFVNTCENKLYKRKIDDIILYLINNIQKNLTVKELAALTGLCERRFHDVFTQMTGSSPKKYIESLKIKNAEELLKNTSLTIDEISFKLGYSSQFHFCTAFKRIKKIPPSIFRRNL